jgi:hypothetical protein
MLSRTILLHDSRFCAVFRIVDILLRIRIRGSAPLINESGTRSCYFVRDLQDANQFFIFSQFFVDYLKVHLLNSSTIKSHKVTEKWKSRFSCYF